jgi:hypothetical protein
MKITDTARSRETCPGGVGFETRSVSGGCGAVLVANSTRPGLHGVRVRVVGIPANESANLGAAPALLLLQKVTTPAREARLEDWELPAVWAV